MKMKDWISPGVRAGFLLFQLRPAQDMEKGVEISRFVAANFYLGNHTKMVEDEVV